MLTINGNSFAFEPSSLKQLLLAQGFRPERVAVERNGVILPPDSYGEVALADGDKLEIVSFVGGG